MYCLPASFRNNYLIRLWKPASITKHHKHCWSQTYWRLWATGKISLGPKSNCLPSAGVLPEGPDCRNANNRSKLHLFKFRHIKRLGLPTRPSGHNSGRQPWAAIAHLIHSAARLFFSSPVSCYLLAVSCCLGPHYRALFAATAWLASSASADFDCRRRS